MIKYRGTLILAITSIVSILIWTILVKVIGWQSVLSPLVSTAVGLGISFLVIDFNSTYVDPKSFASYNGRAIATFDKGGWMWNKKLLPYLTCPDGSETWLRSYASESERVVLAARDGIVFHIIISRPEGVRAVLALDKTIENCYDSIKSFDKLARFVAYEFLNSYVNQLPGQFTRLHNPLIVEQQVDFRSALADFVEKTIEDLGSLSENHCLVVGQGSHFELDGQPGSWVKTY